MTEYIVMTKDQKTFFVGERNNSRTIRIMCECNSYDDANTIQYALEKREQYAQLCEKNREKR